MVGPHGGAVADLARALRAVADDRHTLLPLDCKRAVEADHGRAAAPSRPCRGPRLVPAHDRQHHRAGPPARGRRKRGQRDQALGRSRGGFTTKIHLRCDGKGRPLVLHLTGGERHDQAGFKALLSGLTIKRPQRGRPRSRPRELVADRGYTGAPIRQELKRRGIRAVIPTRSTEKRRLMLDRAAYAQRNRVERLINRLKQYRRIATRYEKRADTYTAFLTLVAIRCWL